MSFNESEERLGELTRKTFLSMWSYQNPHYAKEKELCDALVVFGDDVIIISDKLIRFDEKASSDVAWKRWYKKAITGSIRQLRGALSQITKFPQNIFCDVHASSPFPLKIPSPEKMRVHLIAVANGAESICLESLGHPGLRIDTQCNVDSTFMTMGTKYPEFIHIFSKTSLEAIFDCFDTTRDLIDYLRRKQEALSEPDRFLICGEENLVAAYVCSQPGNGDFHIPSETFHTLQGVKVIPAGLWNMYMESEIRAERNRIRAPSYTIDNLINHIATEFNSGSLIVGQDKPFSHHEKYFRIMASESRLSRQTISATLQDIISEDPSTFWCSISESKDKPGLLYLWLVYPIIPKSVTDEQLEEFLCTHLRDHITVALYKFPYAKYIFGICLPNTASDRNSHGFQVSSGEFRSSELKEEADKLEREQGILAHIQTYNIMSQRL